MDNQQQQQQQKPFQSPQPLPPFQQYQPRPSLLPLQQPVPWQIQNVFTAPPPPAPAPSATAPSDVTPSRAYTTWNATDEGHLINVMSTNWTEIDTCTNNLEKKNLWEKVTNELNALCSGRKSVGAVKRKWQTLKTTFMDINDQVENQTGIGGGPGSERWEHFETMALIIGRDSTVIPWVIVDSMAPEFIRRRRRSNDDNGDDDEGDDDEGEIDDGNDDNSDAEGPEQQQQQNRRQRQRNHQQGQVGRRHRRRTVHEDVGRHHEAMMEVVGNLVNIMDGMKNTLERSIEADQAALERWQQEESRRHDDFMAALMAIRTELRGDTNTNDDSNTNN